MRKFNEVGKEVREEELVALRNLLSFRFFKSTSSNVNAPLGRGTIYIGNAIAINDISIWDGNNGIYASFPSRKYVDNEGNNKYMNFVSIFGSKTRDFVNLMFTTMYENNIEEFTFEDYEDFFKVKTEEFIEDNENPFI